MKKLLFYVNFTLLCASSLSFCMNNFNKNLEIFQDHDNFLDESNFNDFALDDVANTDKKNNYDDFLYDDFLDENNFVDKLVEENDFILDDVADIDKANNYGNTPLNIACFNGDIKMARLLLVLDANVNKKNKHGNTPLYSACYWACNNRDLLTKSFTNTGLELVKLLLKYHADVNQKNNDNSAPLHCACENEYPELVQLLLNNGSNTDSVNLYGNTPLNIACFNGNLEIVKLLIKNHANPLIWNNHGNTPLYSACLKNKKRSNNLENKTKIVKLLLPLYNPKIVNMRNKKGDTPLNLARRNNNLEVINLLLDFEVIIFKTSTWLKQPNTILKSVPVKKVKSKNLSLTQTQKVNVKNKKM